MVEQKEFVILFRKVQRGEGVEEFLPLFVLEGKYDEKSECFVDKNNVKYFHIELNLPDKVVGYGGKTTVKIPKEIISPDFIKKIQKEIFEYAQKFTYKRDYSINEYIVATNKETGDEFLFEDSDKVSVESTDEQDNIITMTPLEIEQAVKKTIKGQDAAIRKIATCLWATLNDSNLTKKQMLLIGPTGVGKTAIFKKLQKVLNIPVVIFSVPGLSQAGYVGRSTDEILKQIYYECGEDITKAEHSIVVLDEIDKIAYSKDNTGTSGVQNELLKMVEGYTRVVEIDNGTDYFDIDTSKIIFVASGAFQELFEETKPSIGFSNQPKSNSHEKDNITTDKLVDYGLKRELIGRFPITVKLEPLTKEIYREIILDSDESELLAHINFLENRGVTITNLDEIIDIIVDDAISKGIGARGLVETISNLLLGVIYEVANNPDKYKEVTIGKDILNNPNDFKLIQEKVKKRTKKANKG